MTDKVIKPDESGGNYSHRRNMWLPVRREQNPHLQVSITNSKKVVYTNVSAVVTNCSIQKQNLIPVPAGQASGILFQKQALNKLQILAMAW